MNNQKKGNMQKALFMLYRYLMQEESNWVRHRGLKRMLYYQGQGVTDALNLRKHAQRKGDIHKTIKLLQRQEILFKKNKKTYTRIGRHGQGEDTWMQWGLASMILVHTLLLTPETLLSKVLFIEMDFKKWNCTYL